MLGSKMQLPNSRVAPFNDVIPGQTQHQNQSPSNPQQLQQQHGIHGISVHSANAFSASSKGKSVKNLSYASHKHTKAKGKGNNNANRKSTNTTSIPNDSKTVTSNKKKSLVPFFKNLIGGSHTTQSKAKVSSASLLSASATSSSAAGGGSCLDDDAVGQLSHPPSVAISRGYCRFLNFRQTAVEDEYHDFLSRQGINVKNSFFYIATLLCLFVYIYYGILLGMFSSSYNYSGNLAFKVPYFCFIPITALGNIAYSVYRYKFVRHNVGSGNIRKKSLLLNYKRWLSQLQSSLGFSGDQGKMIRSYIETVLYYGNLISIGVVLYIDVTSPSVIHCSGAQNAISVVSITKCHNSGPCYLHDTSTGQVHYVNELTIFFMFLPVLLGLGLTRVRWKPQLVGGGMVLANVCFYYLFYQSWESTLTILFLLVFLLMVFLQLRLQTMNHFLLFKHECEVHDDRVKAQQAEADLHSSQLRHIIGGVAHDLKSPLSAFMLGVDTLQYCLYDLEQESRNAPTLDKCKNLIMSDLKDMRKAIEGINTSKRGMLMIINRCLDFNKVSNNIPLVPRPEFVALQDCVQLAIRSVYDMEAKSNILVNYVDPEVQNVVLLTDKLWLDENLLCLLTNAVKYSDPGQEIILRARFMGPDEDEPEDTDDEEEEDDVILDQGGNSFGADVSSMFGGVAPSSGSNSRAPSRPMSVHSAGASSINSQTPSNRSHQSPPPSTTRLVCIEVENRGVGVSEEMLLSGALFDAKLRTVQQRTGGIGLGLYTLACRIKALYGKYGCVQSVDRKRSVFWFAFPPVHINHSNDSNNNGLSKRSIFMSQRHLSGRIPANTATRGGVGSSGAVDEDEELGRGMDKNYNCRKDGPVGNIFGGANGGPMLPVLLSSGHLSASSGASVAPSVTSKENDKEKVADIGLTNSVQSGGAGSASPDRSVNGDVVGVGLGSVLNKPPPIRIDRLYPETSSKGCTLSQTEELATPKTSSFASSAVSDMIARSIKGTRSSSAPPKSSSLIAEREDSGHGHGNNHGHYGGVEKDAPSASYSVSSSTVVESHIPPQQSTSQSGRAGNALTPSNGHSSAIPSTPTYKFAYSTMRKAMVNSIAKLNILVVDDSLPILKMSKMMLQKSGHHVTTAVNGQEALNLMIASLKSYDIGKSVTKADTLNADSTSSVNTATAIPTVKFDVVLMDLQMPIMDGVEAVRLYREFETKFLLDKLGHHVEKSMNKQGGGNGDAASRSSSSSFSTGSRLSSFSTSIPNNPHTGPAHSGNGPIYLNNSTETDNLLDMYENSMKIVPVKSSKKQSFNASDDQYSARSSSVRTAALAATATVNGSAASHQTDNSITGRGKKFSASAPHRNASILEEDDEQIPQTGLFIIGVSANSDDVAIDSAIEAGMDCFIPKPFGVQQFHGIISQHLYQDSTAIAAGGASSAAMHNNARTASVVGMS